MLSRVVGLAGGCERDPPVCCACPHRWLPLRHRNYSRSLVCLCVACQCYGTRATCDRPTATQPGPWPPGACLALGGALFARLQPFPIANGCQMHDVRAHHRRVLVPRPVCHSPAFLPTILGFFTA